MTTPSLIERIHASERPFVMAVTGGGSGAISELLKVPGASASVLEAIVPYSATAMADWLGGVPDQFCSERTARAMAMAAFERARRLSDVDPRSLLGFGATASLASNRPKRGAHRIHIAWQSAETTSVASCTFPTDGTRAAEEELAAQLILEAIANACGVEEFSDSWANIRAAERRNQPAPIEWTELLLGQRKSIATAPPDAKATTGPILFPGAFNPIHGAHMRMAKIAAERFGTSVSFELSITNVDKPPLDFIEIADRLSQFQQENVLLTRAPTFVEKAEIVPGCTFVVGVDTVVRIGNPVYYDGDTTKRDAAIQAIANAACRFLVFGRMISGKFESLSDIAILPALRALCDEVPETVFREDVSSSELRRA